MKRFLWGISAYIIVIVSLAAYFFFLFRDNLVYIEPQVFTFSLSLVIIIFILSLSLIYDTGRMQNIRRYLMMSFLFIIIILMLVTPNPVFVVPGSYPSILHTFALIFTNFLFLPFLIIAFLFSLLIYRKEFPGTSSSLMLFVFIALGLFMVLVSGILRMNPLGTGKLLVGSIYDDENPAGVPVLFAYSLILYSNTFVTTLSVQFIVLILVDLSLIVQNFSFIFRLVSRDRGYIASNAVSAALITVSCQCEGLIATLPAIASLLVSILIYPLIIEGVLLVLLTNILLYFYFLKGKKYLPFENGTFHRLLERRVMILPMVAPIVILVLGSLIGLQFSIYFLYGINILMFIGGIIFFGFLRRVMQLEYRLDYARSVSLFVVSAVLMFSWFVPFLTSSVINSNALYVLMVILTFLSGITTSILYNGLADRSRGILIESTAMMFSLTGLIMLYTSLELRSNPWHMFASYSVSVFAILLVMLSFPLLWLTTNIALNRTVRAG